MWKNEPLWSIFQNKFSAMINYLSKMDNWEVGIFY